MRKTGLYAATMATLLLQAAASGVNPTHVIVDELEPSEPVKKVRPQKQEPITYRIKSPRQERMVKSKSLKKLLKQKGRK